MFSGNHILLLVLCMIAAGVGTVLSVKGNLSAKKASLIFFLICCVSETVKDLSNMIPSEYGGAVLDPRDIPLHLCSLVVFAMLYIVVTKNEENRQNIRTAVAVVGLVAPVFAMLIPTEGVSLTYVITYQYFGYHAALFWYALHLVITKQVTFGKKAYIRNLKYLGITVAALLYLNSLLSVYGVNYCFLREPPVAGLPLLNLDHGWLAYFAVLMLIGVTSVTAVHLPGMIREARN